MSREYKAEWCAGSTLNGTLNYRSRDGWTIHTIHPAIDSAYMILFERSGSNSDHRDHRERLEVIRKAEILKQDLDEAIELLTTDDREPLSEEEKAKWLGRRSHLRDLP